MTQVATINIENTLEMIAAKIITDRNRVNTQDAFAAIKAANVIRELKAELEVRRNG
jgi:hypothetical protein